MKSGDLVKFMTHAWVFKDAEKDYKNPGIILQKYKRDNTQNAYKVMWAEGRVTREWQGYLHVISQGGEING